MATGPNPTAGLSRCGCFETTFIVWTERHLASSLCFISFAQTTCEDAVSEHAGRKKSAEAAYAIVSSRLSHYRAHLFACACTWTCVSMQMWVYRSFLGASACARVAALSQPSAPPAGKGAGVTASAASRNENG